MDQVESMDIGFYYKIGLPVPWHVEEELKLNTENVYHLWKEENPVREKLF